MKRKIFLCVLFLCAAVGYAQQKLKKADKLFEAFAYIEAAEAYEDYLKGEGKPAAKTIMNVADAYYFTGNTASALRWYTKLEQMSKKRMDNEHFSRYLHTLRAEENYQKADDLQKKRLEAKGDKKMLQRFMGQKKFLDSLNGTTPSYTVSNLAVNTSKADFGTAFYGNRIVYASSKDTTQRGAKIYSWNEQPYLDLYVADRNDTDGSFFNETKFIPEAQTQYHNAAIAFAPDAKTVYFSANNVKKSDRLENTKSGTNNIEIVKGELEGSKLINMQGLPFNNTNYSVGHPAITADGKWLFFVSDMPGGYGGTDIYVAELFSDGKTGEPKNLGPIINTAGKEMFPFINDSVLYFSSDGHYGLGGLDIFESSRISNYEFTEPKNLGKPANSNLDDFGFILDPEKNSGYLSSNRRGGKGDDDIYFFTKTPQACKQWVSGKVTNIKYKMGINLADVKVYDKEGNVVAAVKTGEDGTYRVQVPCLFDKVEASKPNHTTDSKKPGMEKQPQEINDINFELSDYDDLVERDGTVEKVAINPIYFDFDKWDITPQASIELDKVVYIMKNFPNLIIKIESHTDSRGKDEYNLTLSANRARSTYGYITARGIEASRIESVNGYGETQLKNKCSNGVECTPGEHLLNRRSDFIVVRK